MVAGHSYVDGIASALHVRLEEEFEKILQQGEKAQIRLFCNPGARISHFADIELNSGDQHYADGARFWASARLFQPDIVLFFLGGNDLVEETNIRKVEQAIGRLHARALLNCPATVFIFSGLEFRIKPSEEEFQNCPWLCEERFLVSQKTYDSLRSSIHEYLENNVSGWRQAYYMPINSLKFDVPANFKSDGVQLHTTSLLQLWGIMMKMVLYVLQ